MLNNYWQRVLYLPRLTQWGIGLGSVVVLSLIMVKLFVIPTYRLSQDETKSLAMLQTQVATSFARYQQNAAHSFLQQKITAFPEIHSQSISKIILSGKYPVIRWQQNERQQEVNLLLGWQSFLFFLSQVRELNSAPFLSSLSLHTQGNEIAVQIVFSSQQE